ncbi:MAG: hypothetical protein MUC50_19955, partial [Myxococcota bacterium]|nr:hypothetical protein [Myxococcota bacterium]
NWSLFSDLFQRSSGKFLRRAISTWPVSPQIILRVIARYSLFAAAGTWMVSLAIGLSFAWLQGLMQNITIDYAEFVLKHLKWLTMTLCLASAATQAAAGGRGAAVAFIAAIIVPMVFEAALRGALVAVRLPQPLSGAISILVVSALFWIPAARLLRNPDPLPSD